MNSTKLAAIQSIARRIRGVEAAELVAEAFLLDCERGGQDTASYLVQGALSRVRWFDRGCTSKQRESLAERPILAETPAVEALPAWIADEAGEYWATTTKTNAGRVRRSKLAAKIRQKVSN